MEIEIKLTYKDKNKIVDYLNSNGFKHQANVSINDTYYGFGENSMSNKNRLFRIRNKNEKIELTMKDSLSDNNGVWTRREININVDNESGVKEMLEAIGGKYIKENCSKREIWTDGKTTFEFISFSKPAKLDLIEIEGKDEQTIETIVSGLGSNITRAGEDVFKIFDNK